MSKKNVKFVEIILSENVEKLGQKGEIKTVRLGYFSNFLMPSGLAKLATAAEKEKQATLTLEKKEEKLGKKSRSKNDRGSSIAKQSGQAKELKKQQ